ncbi:phosphatase PAP2 family protein [Streptomyces sp. NPDC054796]
MHGHGLPHGLSTRPTPSGRPPVARYLWATLPFGALSALLIALVTTGWAPLLEADRRVAGELHESALAHPGWTRANRILTDWVWDPWTMRLLLAVAVLRLWWRSHRTLAVWVAGTAAVAAGIQQLLKALIGRERPEWQQPVDTAHYAAMPSGHALSAALVCVLLLWLLHRAAVRPGLWRLALLLACVSMAGVSFTRVMLGVHWLTDVLVGSLLGIGLALASVAGWHALGARAPGLADAHAHRPDRDGGAAA